MIEQSDIIRAISLPNAVSSVFATMLPNAPQTSEVDKRCLNAPQSLHQHMFLCDSRELIVLFLKKKSLSDMICHDAYIIFAAGKYKY